MRNGRYPPSGVDCVRGHAKLRPRQPNVAITARSDQTIERLAHRLHYPFINKELRQVRTANASLRQAAHLGDRNVEIE